MSATAYASIKLTAAFVDEVRVEADASHRSVAGQVEYWAKLGRAIENTPGFGMDKARDVLAGRVRFEALAAGEGRAAQLAELTAAFDAPDMITTAHFAALGAAEGAVGSNGRGGVLRRTSDPVVRKGR